MHSGISKIWALSAAAALLFGAGQAQNSPARIVGSVKSVSGNSVTVLTDSGSEAVITFAESAQIVRAGPGQADLKSATRIAVSDIEAGDRVLARIQAGGGNSAIASSAIVMKKSDVAARQQLEREEWRRGSGGIVKSVDAAAGTITITNAMAASNKPIVIRVSPETIILRYAPVSVKFDDAKPGTLGQIKAGDQLRARGAKEGETEFIARAIVSGTFRDIAGTVVSTDPSGQTLTVMDLVSKKPVTIQLSSESQLHKLPQMAAMGIAMRLKGDMPGDGAAKNTAAPARGVGGAAPSESGPPAGGMGGGGRGNGGPPDFQQMLNHMPPLSLSDLNKGDAVMLVATEGTESSRPTAITLLSGVEPILSSAPAGTRASTILSPWNLNAGGGGDPAGQ
jgi:hypothetical protein